MSALHPPFSHVTQVDGTQNRVLMKRFAVLGFPSIYLLKDGSTWQYSGMRSTADVGGEAECAEDDWNCVPSMLATNRHGLLTMLASALQHHLLFCIQHVCPCTHNGVCSVHLWCV